MPAQANPDRPTYDPQSLLNSQPLVVTVIDPVTHAVQFQNETGLKQFGDLGGTRCFETIAGQAAPCSFCKMQDAVATGAISSNEVALPGNRYLLVHWSKTVTATGEVHVIETISDITERKRMEDALRHAQKMEAVGRMAGGIAHDFNNLLMVINGYSDRLLRESSARPHAQRLELIKQAGMRAAALTQKLLAFSRQQPLEQRNISLNDSILTMKPLLQGMVGDGIEVMTELDGALDRILMDPVQLEQVIANLVLNARDAMPEGGRITIRTEPADLGDEYVAAHPGARRGRYVALRVSDTGSGMTEETRQHIFDPFFTTKAVGKGTGLGLTTVYGIVKQSHGYIEVESAPGKGASFTLYFPRLLPAQDLGPSPPAIEDDGKTVLVVEDEDSVRLLLTDVLRSAGYRVLEAANGAEGLEVARTTQPPCRLVITDVIMPELTGPAMAKRLRTFLPHVPVLYMSGYTADLLEANGIVEPIQFLQKPILPDMLLAKVQTLLSAT